MKAAEIREKFLRFFENKGHKAVPSAPMVVKDDPTLMFVNAGMNQFKDYFLGSKKPEYPRVTNSQKCLRVSGKHNDLEEVGVDTYHHTMFEMLGNWSFGDYFKKEAVQWAFELLVDELGLEVDRLYMTIYEGEESKGIPRDDEAREYGLERLPKDRVLEFGKEENFWEMGEVGPCGPSAEIHMDIRSEEARKEVDGASLVNKDHPEVIEIWNLVFIQYNRKKDGSLEQLPKKHIDTGMGLERMAMILQGVKSNYDTDIFTSLIHGIEERTGAKHGGTGESKDVAIRVIADHLRAVSFAITDGQLPSNTGAGYVIRRILRRAVRYAYSFLDMEKPFMCELVPVLVEKMGTHFKELQEQQELIQKVMREEEENFLRTLENGLKRLYSEIKGLEKGGSIPGRTAFELYDTYGFPVDLTGLIAQEEGMNVDMEGFQKELEKQKERSRQAGAVEAGDWVELREDDQEEFIGYDRLEAEVRIVRYRKVTVKKKDRYQLVFQMTPFYPESGGQVGDKGYLENMNDGEKVEVIDTKKENDQIIHITKKMPSDPEDRFRAVVDREKRVKAANNHTATHLLHLGLRRILGEHVEQKGSLVAPDHLRFDFSHFEKVSKEQLLEVERFVNEQVRCDHRLEEHRSVPFDEAKDMGAMAIFGEKYGDVVRVIRFGESIELCGGTHVPATGRIGLFKLVSESSVSAGVRRVEAITGKEAENRIEEEEALLDELSSTLKDPKDMKSAVEKLIEENKELSRKLEEVDKHKAQDIKKRILDGLNGGGLYVGRVDLEPGKIKDILFQLKNEVEGAIVVLGTESKGKPNLTVMVTEDLVEEKGLKADDIVKDLSQEIQGGGGGQPFFATAGGKDPSGLDRALEKARNIKL